MTKVLLPQCRSAVPSAVLQCPVRYYSAQCGIAVPSAVGAVPSAVGFTGKGGKVECSWVLKKEHLRGGQVAREDKPGEERVGQDCGRRGHDYFIPNRSKVLVGSYTHLRKEGLTLTTW